MTSDVERRLSSVEAIVNNTLPRIEKYMETGANLRADNAETLGSIKECVLSFKDYQQKCDEEREEHREKLAEYDKRLAASEGFQARQMKAAGAAAGIVAFTITGLIEWLRK